ncbi:hypothetical protein AXW87_01355 [Pseudomonas aeruginosa]|nr:hypothetical protein AXW87_01355 [Pseudomonas aeruginosa]RIY52928.1 hypothetical protein AXW88_01360 [Pseudomonas aeruginosa]
MVLLSLTLQFKFRPDAQMWIRYIAILWRVLTERPTSVSELLTPVRLGSLGFADVVHDQLDRSSVNTYGSQQPQIVLSMFLVTITLESQGGFRRPAALNKIINHALGTFAVGAFEQVVEALRILGHSLTPTMLWRRGQQRQIRRTFCIQSRLQPVFRACAACSRSLLHIADTACPLKHHFTRLGRKLDPVEIDRSTCLLGI